MRAGTGKDGTDERIPSLLRAWGSEYRVQTRQQQRVAGVFRLRRPLFEAGDRGKPQGEDGWRRIFDDNEGNVVER